jgi:hypothetical protein
MKRSYILLLAGVMTCVAVMSGCGKENAAETAVENSAATEQSEPVEEVVAEPESGEQAPVLSESSIEGTIATIVSHRVSSTREDKEWAYGTYPEIILSDEMKSSYPKLSEYINSLNENWSVNVPETVAEYATYALEDTFYDDPQFYTELSVHIERADERLFSMTVSTFDWSGGAHPNSYSYSINVDPITGNDVRLDQILDDISDFSQAVSDKLEENYPGIMEEVDSFYFAEEGDPDQFTAKLNNNSYTYTVTDEGVHIIFSPYEIASYAAGYLEVTLSPSEYPNLIQKAFIMDEPQDMEKLIDSRDGDTVQVEPKEAVAGMEPVSVANPTWAGYVSASVTDKAAKAVSLTKLTEEKTDWINLQSWSEENGVEVASPFHEENGYEFVATSPIGYSYMYNELLVYGQDGEMLYDFDLETVINGPDEAGGRKSGTTQYIRYATIVDNILYVEAGHNEYAENEPDSSYILAIDLSTNELLFRSDPLVANAGNFKVVGDSIICGYGFTAEPDYIYILDRFTGETLDSVKVNSAPEQFEIKDDVLYVATYNTAYTFRIE